MSLLWNRLSTEIIQATINSWPSQLSTGLRILSFKKIWLMEGSLIKMGNKRRVLSCLLTLITFMIKIKIMKKNRQLEGIYLQEVGQRGLEWKLADLVLEVCSCHQGLKSL
jgi:hypothetical protein